MNIVLVGESGSGKTAIQKYLTENFRYESAVTTTTRAMRPGEVDGIDHHFITKEEFLEKLKDCMLCCCRSYNGEFYGLDRIEATTADNKVFILDPDGAERIKGITNCIVFYISCNPEIRENRMAERGNTEEEIIDKKISDEIAFTYEDLIHPFVIVNEFDIGEVVTGILETVAMCVLDDFDD